MTTGYAKIHSKSSENLMPKPKRAKKFSIDLRSALIPLSLVLLFVLRFKFNAPTWVLGLICLWVPLYYVVYPFVLRKKWFEFEKQFTVMFQKGEHKQLLEYYKSQWFLRRFGPNSEMLGKLGLIYSALERYRDAEQAFERAVETAQNAQRDRLYFNLANVKFELNKQQEAAEIYRSLRPGSPYRHAAQTQLALIDIHQGRRVKDASKLLNRELKRATGPLKKRIETALALHESQAP